MIGFPWMAGGALLLSAVSFGAGWQVKSWQVQAEELTDLKKQNKADAKERKRVDSVAAGYEADRAAIQQQGATSRTIIREVYKNVETPANCEPPADALRVLDRAIGAGGNTGEPAATLPAD